MALALQAIDKRDGVIGIVDGAEYVRLLPALFVGDDARGKARDVARASPDAHGDGGLTAPERGAEILLYAAATLLEWSGDGRRSSDSDLLHDVSRLQHVGIPLIGLGATCETFHCQHLRRNRRRRLVHWHDQFRPEENDQELIFRDFPSFGRKLPLKRVSA